MAFYRGEPIILEFSSSNAQIADSMVVRNAGNTAPRVLKLTERIVLNTIVAVVASSALNAMIFDDQDDGGTVDSNERVVPLNIGSKVVASAEGPDGGFAFSTSTVPKVIAGAAGQIDIVCTGYIVQA